MDVELWFIGYMFLMVLFFCLNFDGVLFMVVVFVVVLCWLYYYLCEVGLNGNIEFVLVVLGMELVIIDVIFM